MEKIRIKYILDKRQDTKYRVWTIKIAF